MDVFSIGGKSKSVRVWGPTASVSVKAEALGGIIGDDWLLCGVQVGASEIVDVRQCFNDVSYIYALGNDQAKCSIILNFMVFIGTRDCKGDNNLRALGKGIDEYKSGRISQITSPMTIGIGDFATKGWLVGINIGQTDLNIGVCYGTATFIMQLEA